MTTDKSGFVFDGLIKIALMLVEREIQGRPKGGLVGNRRVGNAEARLREIQLIVWHPGGAGRATVISGFRAASKALILAGSNFASMIWAVMSFGFLANAAEC